MNNTTRPNHNIRRSGFQRMIALTAGILMSCSAVADYQFEIISPPGAAFASAWGINNAGVIVGEAEDGSESTGFVYDPKSGTYTDLEPGFSPLSINNRGVMTGRLDGQCATRDKKGNFTVFMPPSQMAGDTCLARGINARGDVTGSVVGDDGIWVAYTHDPKSGTFEEFLPSVQTFGHGLDPEGRVGGSIFLLENEAYPGSPSGGYGYVRGTEGDVKLFEVSTVEGAMPGSTRARGITNEGLVTGFFRENNTGFGLTRAFVTTLSDDSDFETVNLGSNEIVFQSPCNVDIPPAPGPGFQLITEVTASHINDGGEVVGTCTDVYVDFSTFDFVAYQSGYVARPD